MSVPFPQIDYPRGRLPRGGSDIWDTPQASVVLADDMFASAGPAPTVLTGNNVASTATSTQGAISQTHALTGAASSQANTSTTGAVSQSHTLTGANSAQANTSATGSVTQTHILTGSDCQQANASTTGAVIHTHALAGDNCTQANTCTDGAVTVGSGVIVLTGADCTQANESTVGAITQPHILTGEDCIQVNLGTAGKIGLDLLFRNPAMVLASQGAEMGLREATTEMHLSAIDMGCGLLNVPLSVALTGQALDFQLTPKSTTIGAP